MQQRIIQKFIFGLIFVMGGLCLCLAGCTGDDGNPGPPGERGIQGPPGENGSNAQDDLGSEITNFHGSDFMLTSGEFENAEKYLASATITSASADAQGSVLVNFSVQDENGNPVSGITSASFNIAKLEPPPSDASESFSKWVPYIYRTQTVEGDTFPNPQGTSADQGYRENKGTLTDHGDGSYTYLFATNISNVTANGQAITYDRGLTHRVSVMLGGHSGPTADAVYDFVPDGSAIAQTRNIVQTNACRQCHGVEFHGHGGDRLSIENCVTCHTQGNIDPQSGETLDLKVMIHKIHAGHELSSIAGPDGIVWDNPATAIDETADNGQYIIYGDRDIGHTWWEAGFPAGIENCAKCHSGSGEDVNSWLNTPSREACGSCHDTLNFADGSNHNGGIQTTDEFCATCHPSTGNGYGFSVAEAHNWTTKDQRNIPEFSVAISVSEPSNGLYFTAGEKPVISIALTDVDTGLLLDHRTIAQDDEAEGCLEDYCPDRDGLFDRFYLFVHGPRAKRAPVLTTAARAEIIGTGGPYHLSTAESLELIVDGGKDLYQKNPAGRDAEHLAGQFSVAVADGTFSNPAAVTDAEIVTWLNANSAFKVRAIAYIDEATGFAALRSRNLGDFYSIQLSAGDVTTAVFGGETEAQPIGGNYAGNVLYKHTDPSQDDPKVEWFKDNIHYTLDPVDDLVSGTYVVSVEVADRGAVSASNYKTPSVATATFQVAQAEEELSVADNCGSCHWEDTGNKGMVLDYLRHNKQLTDTAVDQCGACHDYQNRYAEGNWEGTRPISKRVHAVHYGSSLNYPNTTVDYSADPVPGRNWNITFPQDIRYCETCHPTDTSSGTWATKAARLPCSGCHDSLEASSHMTAMTTDPTPENPFSGDETETCILCH